MGCCKMECVPDPTINRSRRSGVPSVPSQTAQPCGTVAMDPLLIIKLFLEFTDDNEQITITR